MFQDGFLLAFYSASGNCCIV